MSLYARFAQKRIKERETTTTTPTATTKSAKGKLMYPHKEVEKKPFTEKSTNKTRESRKSQRFIPQIKY